MRKMHKVLMTGGMAVLLSISVFAQSADDIKRQGIQASYLLAMGKKPTTAEVNYWMSQSISGDVLKTLYENHRKWLQTNPDAKKEMIRRSFKNSYGRTPSESEVNTNMQQAWTYTDWMNNHNAWLKKTPSDYEQAIRFAYQNVVGRQPNSSELTYWKGRGAMAYYVVASCVEQCKRSGSSANCASNVFGTGSSFAETINVAPSVAASASGLIGAAGGNVVAPGGGNVVSAGGANVVAAGGGN